MPEGWKTSTAKPCSIQKRVVLCLKSKLLPLPSSMQERSRPKQPPKKPEAAPFFLPTVPGLAGQPVFDTPAAAGDTSNANQGAELPGWGEQGAAAAAAAKAPRQGAGFQNFPVFTVVHLGGDMTPMLENRLFTQRRHSNGSSHCGLQGRTGTPNLSSSFLEVCHSFRDSFVNYWYFSEAFAGHTGAEQQEPRPAGYLLTMKTLQSIGTCKGLGMREEALQGGRGLCALTRRPPSRPSLCATCGPAPPPAISRRSRRSCGGCRPTRSTSSCAPCRPVYALQMLHSTGSVMEEI